MKRIQMFLTKATAPTATAAVTKQNQYTHHLFSFFMHIAIDEKKKIKPTQ